ncbi:hypothetical protein [Bacillus sp. MCCB 382]
MFWLWLIFIFYAMFLAPGKGLQVTPSYTIYSREMSMKWIHSF